MFGFDLDAVRLYLPPLAVLVTCAFVLWFMHWLLIRRRDGGLSSIRGQLVLLGLALITVILVVLALPVGEATKSDLLSLLGLVFTGIFALASTTFVSNAMAGFMLRSVKSFRHGDFIRVGEHFGRVTVNSLFHTEIQSQERDLITLPNLYLTTNPLTVVRSSGTFTSCEVSLGYDVAWHKVEPLLKLATQEAGLDEPFVQILTLGDFSIVYKTGGICSDVNQLLTQRTRLKKAVLDQLHGAGIEIVSPNFMNQRQLSDDQIFSAVPQYSNSRHEAELSPETKIFDKAAKVVKIRTMLDDVARLKAAVDKDSLLLEGADKEQAEQIKLRIVEAGERIKSLENIIEKARENQQKEENERS
ncbi:MAG: mechanosensitive ion channel [Porticoccaceae bacterium]|nr:mechanosensitive ion channel [Porticoccaceae bacterium]